MRISKRKRVTVRQVRLALLALLVLLVLALALLGRPEEGLRPPLPCGPRLEQTGSPLRCDR